MIRAVFIAWTALTILWAAPANGLVVQTVKLGMSSVDGEQESYSTPVEIEIDPALAAYPVLYGQLADSTPVSHSLLEVLLEEPCLHLQENCELSHADIRYSSHTRWMLVWSNDEVVSAFATFAEYAHGEFPNHRFSSVLWDVAESRELTLANLLSDARKNSRGLVALSEMIRAEILSQKAELFPGFDANYDDSFWLDDLTASLGSFPVFTLAPSTESNRAGGIIVHFAPLDVGYLREGAYHILVPQAVFADYLDPQWANLFGGEPDINADALAPQ